MAKILIVDDEPRIRELIRENLQYSGYTCEEAGDGSAALSLLTGGGYDLVILDLMMPFMDGMTCLREMRTRRINTPVIILTARGEEYDKLAGLEGGADDYVVKPFSPRELVARVKAVLNRTMPRTEASDSTMTFGELSIDTASHTVKVSGEEVSLTPKEFDLLVFLASNKGIALSREKILQKVWNYDYFGEDRTVDTHVKMLRGHLGKCRGYIATVWGIGYKFDPDAARYAEALLFMRQTSKTRRTIGIRGQLMGFLCFICLLLVGLFWFLSTQLLEPLYTTHIQKQLTEQAEAIVARMDEAIGKGETLSYWAFGSRLYVNNTFFNALRDDIFELGGMSSFCIDISDTTLRQIFKVDNLSYCNLHRTRPTDTADEQTAYTTARAMRQLCRESGGTVVRKINPPTPSGSVQLMVGRMTSDGNYTVLVTTSLMHVAEAGKVLSTVLPLAAALIFAFSMSAAWLFSEWFTKPLRALSGAARQVAQGNYAVHVDSVRNDELGDLAQEFNHMAKEVQHASQMQRDLLANVSHDLRTPLTLIKGYAETVRDLTGDDKKHRDEQMNIIVDETDRLTALVSSVMELSKVTSGALKCEKVHFDMGQLCDEVSERYDAVCAQNGWQLKLEIPDEELPVYADPDMMQRALHNLLGNAMHHIGEDGIFVLRALRCPEGVRVEVEDHGPGISAEDLPYIFDRYYRSRSDAGKQGTGLGLSITKAIFQQHGFRFGVHSTVGKGTVFWFIMTDTEDAAAQ